MKTNNDRWRQGQTRMAVGSVVDAYSQGIDCNRKSRPLSAGSGSDMFKLNPGS